MSSAVPSAVLIAAIGSALVGGIFHAFTSFVMTALSRVPTAAGMAVMQSINVVVLNRSFLGRFMGTAAISLLVALVAIVAWGTPPAPFWLAGVAALAIGAFITGEGRRFPRVSSTMRRTTLHLPGSQDRAER